jgi:MFS family permease
MAPPLLQPSCAADGGTTSGPPARGDLPLWWLFFLPLYWFPQSMAWTLVETYLLPFQVAAIVGDSRKHLALSLMMVAANLGSLLAPVFASCSDKAVGAAGRRMRRPFVVVGQLLFGVAVFVLATARGFLIFLLGYLVYTLTASISGPPYAAIYTELIPEAQRGTYGAFWNWQGLVATLGGSGLGALVGEGMLTNWGAYAVAIGLALLSIGPGLVGLGERPGCWAPEPRAPPKVVGVGSRARRGCGLRALLLDFASAFGHAPFRWLFLTNMLNNCYSQLCSIYYVYWFQDEIAPRFDLLGHHLTSSTRAAVAIGSTISIVCSFVLVLPGGWLADRYRRTTIMFATSLLQTVCPLMNALYPTFGLVCLTSLISGVLGGVGSAAGRAIIADCVPLDLATGRPLDPGRDLALMNYSGFLPRIILPAILGLVFTAFDVRSQAYRAFFLAATVIHLGSSLLYLQVGRAQMAGTLARRASGEAAGTAAGAAACDSLCFRSTRQAAAVQ